MSSVCTAQSAQLLLHPKVCVHRNMSQGSGRPTWMVSVSRSVCRLPGMKPAPMPWILCGPGLPPEMTGDSVGSTAMTCGQSSNVEGATVSLTSVHKCCRQLADRLPVAEGLQLRRLPRCSHISQTYLGRLHSPWAYLDVGVLLFQKAARA